MDIIILVTSAILFIFGLIGLLHNKTLIHNIISIETITLSSVLNFLSSSNTTSGFVLILVIITTSELSFAILFVIINKIYTNINV